MCDVHGRSPCSRCRTVTCCCPRERFTGTCSSQPACDLDRYCIKSSPISCNPCLGRRSFRHCSAFSRPASPYYQWCADHDCSRPSSSAAKKSRKSSSGKRDTGSSSVRPSSARSNSASDSDEDSENANRKFSRRSSDSTAKPTKDSSIDRLPGRKSSEGSRKSTPGKNANAGRSGSSTASAVYDGKRRKSSRKSRRSTSTAEASGGDDRSGDVPPVGDNETAHNARSSQKSSRKSSVSGSARGSPSKSVVFEADVDSGERSSAGRARRLPSRRSSTNENRRRDSSAERSSIQSSSGRSTPRQRKAKRKSSVAGPSKSVGFDADVDSTKRSSAAGAGQLPLRCGSADDDITPRRESSVDCSSVYDDDGDVDADRPSVTRVPRSTQTSQQHQQSPSRRDSRSSSDGGKSTNHKARFASMTKFLSGRRKYRKTPYDVSSPGSTSRSSSSMAAAGGVGPRAQCSVRRSVCAPRASSHPPQPPPYCARRSAPKPCVPRDRFSLYRMPFFRSGFAPFAAAVATPRESSRALVVAYDDAGSAAGLAHASLTSAADRVRSTSSRSHEAAFIGSMPPPGTSFPPPPPTFSSVGGRQVSATAAPPPQYAGYREHLVTTTSHTVRAARQQNANFTSNAATSRPAETGGRLGRTGADSRGNQTSATSLGDVAVTAASHASPPGTAVAPATERTDTTPGVHGHDLTALFDKVQRDIMEAYDKSKQILQ